jgi:folate-dependent phosphoribosylglycinamide formyltransferase PurN
MSSDRKRVGFFGASGADSGSGIRNVLQWYMDGKLPSVRPVVVISCNPTGGIARVSKEVFDIAFHHFEKPWNEAAWQGLFDRYQLDYLWLIGCSIRAVGLEDYTGRVGNEHPADLRVIDPKTGKPRFGGKGMTDIHVHEAVVASWARHSGSTSHFVSCTTGTDEDYDAGGLIINVHELTLDHVETPQTLQERIKRLQKETTPLDIEAVASGRIRCERNARGFWRVVRD